MMVNQISDSEVMLVLQIDHSRVAGQLAANWGGPHFAPVAPYESIVLAAQEHDTGWWEWEMKPTLNRHKRPLDYIGSASYLGPIWLDFYRRVVDRVTAEDPYAGYIVSMHGDGLLTSGMGLIPSLPDQSGDPLVDAFIDEQKAFRAKLLPNLRKDPGIAPFATDDEIWTNYKYMEVFDQFAQFVCNRYPFNSTLRKTGPSPTLSDLPIPTRRGEPDTTLLIDVRTETTAVVTPYPFEIDPLVIAFVGRILPAREYADRHEFLKDFYTAEPVTVRYTLHSSDAAARRAA
jgi:hypothetical protein